MDENIMCRLCFNVVKNEFEVINAVVKHMLEVLLLNMDLEASENPILCLDCAEIVKKSYFFKTACMDAEEIILSFSITKEGATFDMKDIYKDSKDIQGVADEDLNICRFCMNEIGSSSFVSVDKLVKDMIYAEMFKIFMPEMGFSVIKDPVICTSCWENLECYVKFRRNCLDIEEKIKKYRQNEGINSASRIKLSNVLGFLFKDTSGYPENCTKPTISKQESLEQIKCEPIDIKHEEIDSKNTSSSKTISKGKYKCAECTYESKCKGYLKNHMLKHKDISEVEMYKCTLCTYETKYHSNIKQHMLKHKDISEVKMHKCAICSYETKYKWSLKSHVLSHKDTEMPSHKDAPEIEMYKCKICTFETRYKKNIKHHMLIHKDSSEVEMYKCTICTYETKYRYNFRKHMAIHDNTSMVKKYKCEICTHETRFKNDLRRHMLKHKHATEVEMHKCGMCRYQTKYKECLKRHLLRHLSWEKQQQEQQQFNAEVSEIKQQTWNIKEET